MHPLIKRIRFDYIVDLVGQEAFGSQLRTGDQPDPIIAREHFTLIIEIDRSCAPDPSGAVGLDGPLALELVNWGRNYIAENNIGEFVRYIKLVEAG